MAKRAQNRGPYILAAGAAAQLLTGIPAAWGVFQQPVMQGYGFSRGQAMLAFAVLVAAYGVGCAIGGLLQDAHGPRFAGLWGTALLAGGFFAASLVPVANAVLFLLVYSLPAGLGSAFLAPAVLACAQKWYKDKKGCGRCLGHPRLLCGPGGRDAGNLRRGSADFARPARPGNVRQPPARVGLAPDGAYDPI